MYSGVGRSELAVLEDSAGGSAQPGGSGQGRPTLPSRQGLQQDTASG